MGTTDNGHGSQDQNGASRIVTKTLGTPPVSAQTAELQMIRRARDLETVAELSVAISTILSLEPLLNTVTNLTRDRFDLYHAQVYLVDGAGKSLALQAGSGDVGQLLMARGHNIPVEAPRSLVARTFRTKQAVVINDVTQEPDHMSNALLPDTRSEAVLPLIVGENIIGVLDVQADKFNHFDSNDVTVLTSLAAQIAIAIQNARSFDQLSIYQQAFNSMQSGLFVYKLENPYDPGTLRLIAANEAAARITSIPVNDIIGYTLTERFPMVLDTPLPAIYASIARGERASFESEEIFYSDDRSVFNAIAIKAFPLANQSVGVTFDNITDRKKVEAEVIQAKEDTEKRARDLETVAEVSRAVTTILNVDELLQTVADLTKEKFGLYHSHIYLLDDAREFLRLAGGAGEIGQAMKELGHKIPLGREQSLVARAARTGKGVVINDVRAEEGFLPNALLPDTRSEMAIPMIVSDNVIGVLDVQSDEIDRFSDTDVNVITSLAAQIAIAVENARSVAEVEQSRRDVEKRARDLQTVSEVSRAVTTILSVDELLQTVADLTKEKFGLYHSHVYLLNDTRENLVLAGGAGEIGQAMKELGHKIPLSREQSLVARAARTGKGVVINDVRAEEGFLPNALLPDTRSEMAIPMIVSDRVIGVLDVQADAINSFRETDVSVITSLAGQIAIAVENARSVAQVEQSRRDVEKRARDLQTVSEVSRAVTTEFNLVQLLQTVADLTKEKFGLYHSHIYLTNEEHAELDLAAGSGDAGRMMKSHGHRISMSHPRSMVARAARSGLSVISNDVTQESGFLPNALLPETRSELATPLILGDRVIGVLDIQSTDVNRFDDNDARVMSTLAGQIAVAVENAHAVTRIEEQAERERETAQRLREVDRLKSQFLANMSHELRTPLNSIIGYSEILLDGDDGELTEEAVEDVSTIHQSGQHLLMLINDILDLAKIEAGQMSLDRRSVDLSKLAGEVLHASQVLVKDKPVELRLVQESPVTPVHADALRIRQVLTNLISNAVKFTEKGSVTLSVGMNGKHEAYVAVTDTGMGIAKDHLHLIFEQFQQVDGSSTRRAGGTGLGLTITRHLIQMHGGEIYVDSQVGVGSIFRFTLPVEHPVESSAT